MVKFPCFGRKKQTPAQVVPKAKPFTTGPKSVEEGIKWTSRFGSTSTFHGPNHAFESNLKPEKAFWIVLFVIGLGVAVYQSYLLLSGYFADLDNMKDVTSSAAYTDPGYEWFPLTICKTKWINWKKVGNKIDKKKMPAKIVLFGLSLIPSLKKDILDDMKESLSTKQLKASDNIWGLRECVNAKRRRRRRRRKRFLKSISNVANNVVNTGSNLINDVGNMVGDVVDTAGDFVNTVVKEADVLKALEEFDPTKLVNKMGDLAAPLFSLSTMLMGGKPAKKAMDVVVNLMRQRCACRANLDQMKNWKDNADEFAAWMQQNNYTTLTEFFSDLAYDMLEVFEHNGEFRRVGWRIYDGMLCQVVTINVGDHQSKSNGDQKVAIKYGRALSDEADDKQKLYDLADNKEKNVANAASILIPYATESAYDENIDAQEIPQRVIDQQLDEFTPKKIFDLIRKTLIPTVGITFTKVINAKGIWGCKVGDPDHRVPLGYGRKVCEKKCRHEAEVGSLEAEHDCLFVTRNFVGDIPVGKRLCPGSLAIFKENRTRSEITAEASKCILEQDCAGPQHVYCNEWDIDLDVVDVKMSPVGEGKDCNIEQQLSHITTILSFPMITVLEKRANHNWIDIFGIVGGIFGLYVGASILTFVHAIIFCLRQMCRKRAKRS